MLRVQPTKVVLKSEDLEEYNIAKQQWDEAAMQKTTSNKMKEEQNNADSTTQHRQGVRSRIGIPK